MTQLFLASPSHLVFRWNWDKLSRAASARQHCRGQDSREQAELEGHCHQPLTPCHGRAPALLISLYFPLQCIWFYIILCLQCFPPLTGSRAVTQHPTPGLGTIPFTDLGSISAQFIALDEKNLKFLTISNNNFTRKKPFRPLTFVTLGLYRDRTLQEFTRTGTSKDSTVPNHISKPKTHSLLFKFTDLSMGQSQRSHSVPPVPQDCDTSGDGATVGPAETEGAASPWDSAQELRKLTQLRLQRAQRTWGFRK